MTISPRFARDLATPTCGGTIAGSERELAVQLKVEVRQVENWLSGVDGIPEQVFQAALDLVIGSSRQAIFRSRELLQRASR